MTWAIAETDARFPYLGKMMAESGYAVAEAGGDASADGLIARYPFSPEAEKTLQALKPGAPLLLLAGARPPETLLNLYDVRLLLDDPVFVHENAVLTAEGALCAAMRDAPFALVEAHVMVVGYGRIGRALTERLVGLNADVTVASRREEGRLQAMARGARAASLDGMRALLSEMRVIFVTSPDRALGMEELSRVSRNAVVIDLSGAPYGLDLDAAKRLGLNARRESALPGRYAPESAARCLYRAVARTLNGGDEA